MAIYDQSYTPWVGTYSPRASRIAAMVEMELALPFKNLWVLISVLSWMGSVYSYLFPLALP